MSILACMWAKLFILYFLIYHKTMEHENSHNLSSTGIFVEIAKNKLCGSKL